jgi:hypothetical protein
MPSWRLSANGNATDIGAALMPVPAQDAGAWSSRGPVNGHPGTMAVAAPAPAGVPQDWSRRTSGSAQAGVPQSILPSLYWLDGPQEHAPVSTLSDNQMPVPAIDPRGKPGVVMPGPVMLGQQQVTQPRAIPKYMNRR